MSRCPHVPLDVLREHQRPDRYFELEILPRSAGPLCALPVFAALSAMLGVKPILDERVHMRARNDVDGAAAASVTAVGSAARDEFLPTEAHRSTAAVSGRDFDLYFVDKHRNRKKRGS